MAVTIKDVAAAAGVSISTVSKVLNGWTSISEETTNRVNEVIRDLHYIPNARAVSFARKATMNVVFLTSLERENAYKNPHMFDIMCGAYQELSKNNYSMSLVDTSAEKYLGETVANVLSDGNATGIIVHGSAINEETAALIIEKNFPHTVIGCPNFENQLCWIDTNQKLGGQFAAEHLLSLGYKKVAFIGGRKTDIISQHRLTGVRHTMTKAGYRMDNSHILYTDASIDSSERAAINLIQSDNPPEAIICENNLIALGVSRAFHKTGIKVPNDMAFMTFDRYPYTNVIEPTPTIIDIDVYDMGVQAAITLMRKLENPALLVQSYTTLPLLIQGKTK